MVLELHIQFTFPININLDENENENTFVSYVLMASQNKWKCNFCNLEGGS